MLRFLFFAVLMVALPVAAEAFWGAKASEPADADPTTLKPGQFVWDADAVPSGPLVVVVSLPEQRADVYRNGVRIGVTTVSTGKPGHQTPTGVFTILQKDVDHHSTKYNNAPMPYAERLTWDGVALHAGGLPGYPSSHGCVHLPSEFARQLFQISPMGMTVVIANAQKSPVEVVHPAALVAGRSEDRSGGRRAPAQRDRSVPLAAGEVAFRPALHRRQRCGPARARLSQRRRDRTGEGRAGRTERAPRHPRLHHAGGRGHGDEPHRPGKPAHRWIAVGLPGHAGEDKTPLDPSQVNRVRMPRGVRERCLRQLSHPAPRCSSPTRRCSKRRRPGSR